MGEVELRLPTDVAYVGLARLVVTTAARQAGMDDGRVEDLKIAVSEATTNAILARQGRVDEDPVVLTFGPNGERFEVTIRDASLGSPPRAEDGELTEAAPVESSGLGVTVIRGLTDRVDFIEDGADRVHMRFGVDLREDAAPAG